MLRPTDRQQTRLDAFLGFVGLLLIGIIGWTADRFSRRPDFDTTPLDTLRETRSGLR